jgi:hypothetical protein
VQLATEIQRRICRFLFQKISPLRQYQSYRHTSRVATEDKQCWTLKIFLWCSNHDVLISEPTAPETR